MTTIMKWSAVVKDSASLPQTSIVKVKPVEEDVFLEEEDSTEFFLLGRDYSEVMDNITLQYQIEETVIDLLIALRDFTEKNALPLMENLKTTHLIETLFPTYEPTL